MLFNQEENRWFQYWYISHQRKFAIGILNELYNRKKIQVFARQGNEWKEIQHYLTYKNRIVGVIMSKIFTSLYCIDERELGQEDIEKYLPIKKFEYVEQTPKLSPELFYWADK